jgi:hypothetical protein
MDSKMDNKYLIFPSYGVLTETGSPDFGIPIQSAYTVGDTLTTVNADGSETPYETENVSEEGKTGRIVFKANDTEYRIRELREDDGYWMSKYKTLLPISALELLIKPQSKDIGMDITSPEDTVERLTAYATDSSVYVIGLVYENALGRWVRIDGDWSLMAEDDKSFFDAIVIDIDPDRGDEYIEMFDKNYVTVTDTENYEIPTEETE